MVTGSTRTRPSCLRTDYYLQRTSHGSTLSGVVHAWVLARANRERSWAFFRQALESDISDIQGGTTREGVHLGAMAGTVDLLQRCYSGLEVRGGVLRFQPYLPRDLPRLYFNIQYRSNWLEVDITAARLALHAQPSSASPVEVAVGSEQRTLSPGSRTEFELDGGAHGPLTS
jgi:trehalose/maltose hydrolase-like predicted phosphorylase